MVLSRLGADTWMRCWALGGAVLLAVAAIVSLPWLLWVGWVYLGVLGVVDVVRGDPDDRASSV